MKTGRGSRTLIVQAREDDKLDKVVPGTVDDLGCVWEAGSPCLTDELRVEVSKMKNWAWLLWFPENRYYTPLVSIQGKRPISTHPKIPSLYYKTSAAVKHISSLLFLHTKLILTFAHVFSHQFLSC